MSKYEIITNPLCLHCVYILLSGPFAFLFIYFSSTFLYAYVHSSKMLNFPFLPFFFQHYGESTRKTRGAMGTKEKNRRREGEARSRFERGKGKEKGERRGRDA